MKTLTFVTLAWVLPTVLAFPQTSAFHELKLLPENVHWGYYDAAVKPVLRVASGDTIRVETMVARGLLRLRAAGVAEDEIPNALKVVERTVTERGPGAHPLTGPIWIEGAEPGDVLEVKVLGIEFLHPYGVTGFIPNSGTLPDDFPYARFKLVRFNVGFIELALLNQAPLVPTAVIGGEEQMPILAKPKFLAKAFGLPYFPITPTFPWLGPLGGLPYPTKYHIRFGEPLHFHKEYGPDAVTHPDVVRKLADEVQEIIQEMLNEGLKERKGIFT